MKFSLSTLAILSTLLTMVMAVQEFPNYRDPSDTCDYIDQDGRDINWYPEVYLHNDVNIDLGKTFYQVVPLNGIDWQFRAGSGYYFEDFVNVTGGKKGKGQFKIAFKGGNGRILAAVWAEEGTSCKLKFKLNKDEVASVTIAMRQFFP
jgi:hypothetical protein